MDIQILFSPFPPFNLAVDNIPKTIINKLQMRATSYLKSWLKMPKCATFASLFQPEVANFPYLPYILAREGQV